MKEPEAVHEKKSRMIRGDPKNNPFELEASPNRSKLSSGAGAQVDSTKTVASNRNPNPSPKSRMIKSKDQFSSAFELKSVPGMTSDAAKPKPKMKMKNENSLEAFELQVPPTTVKSTVTGAGLSRFDKPSSERKEAAAQAPNTSQQQPSAKPTLGRPGLGGLDSSDKDKKSSWAALTKKQTGVGTLFVLLTRVFAFERPEPYAI